jgi:hypothetical protein
MPDTNFWIHDNIIRNSNSENLDLPGGNLHLIERNQFYGSKFLGNIFKMHSEYNQITDCIIRDNVVAGSAYDSESGNTSFGFALEGAKRCIIESNTFSGRYCAQIGDNEHTGWQSLYGTFEDNIIRNNNFYGDLHINGVGNVGTWGYTRDHVDSIAFYNTFEGNNYYINAQYSDWRLFRMSEGDNILDDKCISTTGSTLGRGDFEDIWVAGVLGTVTNETNVSPEMNNPVWTSPTNPGDYTLSTNPASPLIDSGSPTGNDHIYDINLNVRTQGTIDKGAYETSGGVIRPAFIVTAYSGGTYTAPTFNYGTVQTSETKTGYINLTNISPDSSIFLDSVTLGGVFDSLFTFVNAYDVSGLPSAVSLPYRVDPSGVVRLEVEFDGSTIASAKTATLSLAHSSTAQTTPIVINLNVTVSDGSVTYAIAGDTAKVFTSALGAEELTNSDLTDWTSTDPNGWTIQGEDALPSTANSVNETTTGSGVARLKSDGTYVSMKQYSVTTSGGRYLFDIDIDAVTLGSLKFINGSQIKSWNTSGIDKFYFVADGNHTAIERGSSSTSHEVDINYVSIKEITSSWNATATITATGNLTCDDISLTNGTNFSVTSATSFDLADGETYSLTYSFAPSDTGYFQDTIIISGINASNKTVDSLFIEGYFESGYSPSATKNLKTIGLTGSTFSITSADTGSSSADSVQFYNDGDGDLTLDSLVWSGGDSDQFTLLSLTTNDSTLSAGDTTDLGIQFSPTSSGVKTAYLSVYHNGDNITSPLVITVTAQATIAQTDPYIVMINPPSGNLSVGTIEVNSTSNVSLIWTNTGTTTFTYSAGIDGVSGFVSYLSGGGLNDSTQQDEVDTLTFAVTPTSDGAFTDTVRFSSHNASNWTTTQEFVITGTAVNTSANFAIDKSGYYFGIQDTSDADTISFTITNDRADALGDSIVLAPSEQFTLLNSSQTAVTRSIAYSTYTTYTFYIVAQPTDEMYYEADVYIYHNASNTTTPQTVTVSVTGDVVSKLAVIPTNYHFGSVYLGDTETSSDIIIYNKGRNTIAVDSIYLATNSVFTLPDTLSASLPGNIVYCGGFDKDTLWTFSNTQITDNKLQFVTGSFPSASQTLSGLRDNNAYLVVMDISNHTGSGDALTITLGGGVTEAGTQVSLTASQYSNGTLAIQMFSGSISDDLSIIMYNGNFNTRIDNVTVTEYTTSQVTFTPIAGTTLNADNLSIEHDASNTNPYLVPITGYMTSGGITINGNIEVNTVKKK